jgi:hypothetical protein
MESTAAHDKTPNWVAFQESMQDIGLKSIEGLPEDLIEWLRLESRGSELLNIDDEQDAFVEDFAESPCLSVVLVFEEFVETVRRALSDLPFARGSEGWAKDEVTGHRISWGQSIDQLRGNLAEHDLQMLIAAAESPARP